MLYHLDHRLQLKRWLWLCVCLILFFPEGHAFQGIVRGNRTRPTLWLPMFTDVTDIGKTGFTTSSQAITFGSAGSRNATVYAGVTGAASGNRVFVTNNEASLSLGTGDFTIEFWVYPNTLTAQPYIVDYRPFSNQTANFPAIRLLSTGAVTLQHISGGVASNVYTTATGLITTSAWNHVALVRSGGTMTFYINGTANGSYSTVENFTVTGGSQRPLFGSSAWSYTGTLDGYLYDMKVWVGDAIYKGNFVPNQ